MSTKPGIKNFIKVTNLYFEYKLLVNKSLRGRITSVNDNSKSVKVFENLNLHIKSGDKIGLFSPNGTGKTTLLKILSGIYPLDPKTVQINGKVNNMISLAGGFIDEATGEENIFIECYYHGLQKHEVKKILNNIIEFADLGKFIKLPLRTYSTGMRMRLAFSIITNINSDIIIMDEWLSVGDKSFKNKANEKLKKYLSVDKILILASHDIELIRENCNSIYTIKNFNLVKYD